MKISHRQLIKKTVAIILVLLLFVNLLTLAMGITPLYWFWGILGVLFLITFFFYY